MIRGPGAVTLVLGCLLVAERKRRFFYALGLFAVLFAAYTANGYTSGNNDATANVRLAQQILERGRWTFTPDDSPFMFVWKLSLPDRDVRAHFHAWDELIGGESARSLRERGALTLVQSKYYVVPTRQQGSYANTFGVGSGLLALPVVAAVKLFVSPLDGDPVMLWRIGKVVAAAATAGTAVFLFLAALSRLSLAASLCLALLFGLGTCLFSVSSQNLFQHGPAGLFLAMGTHLRLKKMPGSDALSGLAFVCAVACRPTCILVVAVVAAWLAFQDRRALLRFCIGAAPIALLLAWYGWRTFGDPFAVGQSVVANQVAMTKTGNPGMWQTPFLVGAAGLLVSPSRGLLVYSPIVVVALWGAGRAWRDRTWAELRPLTIAALLLFLPAAKRFDWWGGWTWAYRPILESVVLLAFLAIPMVASVQARRWRLAMVGVLALWSIGVHTLAAFAYDVRSWNGRRLYEVVELRTDARSTFEDRVAAEQQALASGGRVLIHDLNVDRPENRDRLWSWRDNPIGYYLREWGSVRAHRQQDALRFMREDG